MTPSSFMKHAQEEYEKYREGVITQADFFSKMKECSQTKLESLFTESCGQVAFVGKSLGYKITINKEDNHE